MEPCKLTEDHIKHMIYNLLCSLNFIHSFNIVHRDIKPANILVNDACQIKLCDFGLARSIQLPVSPAAKDSQEMSPTISDISTSSQIVEAPDDVDGEVSRPSKSLK